MEDLWQPFPTNVGEVIVSTSKQQSNLSPAPRRTSRDSIRLPKVAPKSEQQQQFHRLHVDLSMEEDDGPPMNAALTPHTLQEKREVMRGFIAGALILLVALMVVGAFALAFAGYSKDLIKDLFVLFTPVVALASGVCGYYFGAHRNTA